MVILNERQSNILRVLADKKEYTTIKLLAREFEVSERTIRYDLDNIEYLLRNKEVTLIRAPRYGTKLAYKGERDKNIIFELLDSTEVSIYSQEERIITLALLLLTESMTIDKLTEKLCVSKNTVLQDMKKVKSIFKNLNIDIESKLYSGISLKCKEEDIRYAFMNLYYKSKNSNSIDIYKILENKTLISKNKISKIIKNIESKFELEYSERSFEELTVIIFYTLNRITSKNHIEYENNYIEEVKIKDEFNIIKNELKSIKSKVNISDFEICYLLKWFKGAKIISFIDVDSEEEIKHIAARIIEDMEECTGVEFSKDTKFVNSVVMHFNVAIYRLKNNFIIENPLTEEIKYRIGLIYQITEDVLKKYEKTLRITFPESEIAYMAMYFGARFEKNANEVFMPKALIVCNSGLSIAELLNSRINTILPQIEVVGICRLNNLNIELSKVDIDFIVTTVPIKNDKYRIAEVNPLLNKNDIDILKNLTFNTIYEKSSQYLVSRYKSNEIKSIDKIINKSNTKFEVNISDWREAIRVASNPLLKNDDIKNEYIEEMIKVVEELGTYMVFIPEIAFIHATPKYVNHNSVSLITLKNKIYFGDNSEVMIKAIVILANKYKNKNLIDLINILIKNNNIGKLKKSKSYLDLSLLV